MLVLDNIFDCLCGVDFSILVLNKLVEPHSKAMAGKTKLN